MMQTTHGETAEAGEGPFFENVPTGPDFMSLAPDKSAIDKAAAHTRELLRKFKVLAVALVGPPGAGKTALIEAVARQLRGKLRVGVIIVNPAAQRDANRVLRYCAQVEPVSTALPDAQVIQPALTRMDLAKLDLIFIESVGGISGTPEFGQDLTVTVLSVTGGDDKAAEYARLLIESPILILSKCELQRHVMFDRGAFRHDVRKINPLAELIEVSAFENRGLSRWLVWLERRLAEKNPKHRAITTVLPSEWFFG